MLAELRAKSQITIPKKIVEKLALNEGDKLEVYERDGVICLMPVVVYPKKHFDALLGKMDDTQEKVDYRDVYAMNSMDELFAAIEVS